MPKQYHQVKNGLVQIHPTDILKCPHLEISTDNGDAKISCLECGLVQDQTSKMYVRSITHYKQLIAQGIKPPPIYCLVGEALKRQVAKYHLRQMSPKKKGRSGSGVLPTPLQVNQELYDEYLQFLRDNLEIILPKKERKRPLVKIYGDHYKIISSYIELLLGQALLTGSP